MLMKGAEVPQTSEARPREDAAKTSSRAMKKTCFIVLTLLLTGALFASCKRATKPRETSFVAPDNTGTWLCNAAELAMPVDASVARSLYQCPRGSVQDSETGHCCEQGKTYSVEQEKCVGEPVCSGGLKKASVYDEEYCTFDDTTDPVTWSLEACEQGNLRNCDFAGALLRGYKSVPADFVRARELVERACGERLLSACASLANMHMHSAGIARDTDFSVKFNRELCAAGSPMACHHVGFALEGWEGKEGESIPYYKRACEGGSTGSCNDVRRITLGRDATLEQARSIISGYLERCEERELDSCGFYLRSVEALGYQTSPTSRRRALEMIESTCTDYPDLDDCFGNVAGLEPDNAMFFKLEDRFEEACQKEDNYTMCYQLGAARFKIYPEGETRAQLHERVGASKGELRKACEEGKRPHACWYLSNIFHYEAGKGQAGSDAKKIDALERACDYGYHLRCTNLGRVLYDPNKPQAIRAAHDAYKKGCENNITSACSEMAGVLTKHPDVFELTAAQANASALPHHRASCHKLTHVTACLATAKLLLQKPEASPYDQVNARHYLRFACNEGSSAACHEFLLIAPDKGEEFFSLLREDTTLVAADDANLKPLKIDALDKIAPLISLSKAVKNCDSGRGICFKNKARFHDLILASSQRLKEECEGGSGASCSMLMRLVDEGLGPLEQDLEATQGYARRGCELGDVISCTWIVTGTYFGRWGDAFDGEAAWIAAQTTLQANPADPGNARRLVATAFARGIPSSELESHLRGHCEALEKKNEACQASSRNLVLPLARYYPVAAHAFTRRQCEVSGHSESCALLARAMFELDRSSANEHVPTTCEPGEHHPTLCVERGWQLLQDVTTASEGEALLSKLCEEGAHVDACQELGTWLIAKPTLAAQSRGRELLKKACDDDHMIACYHLGMIYREGTDKLDPEKDRASTILEKSCDGYYRPACLALRSRAIKSME